MLRASPREAGSAVSRRIPLVRVSASGLPGNGRGAGARRSGDGVSGLCSVAVLRKPFWQLRLYKWLCSRHSRLRGGVHPTARHTTVMRGGRMLRTAALTTNGKTIGGYATFAERGPPNSSKMPFAKRGAHRGNLLYQLLIASLVQPRTATVLRVQTYTLVAPATPTWPWKTPFVMSTKRRGNQSNARHASCYSSWSIKAKIAAANRDITLSKPFPAQLSACVAARATARRNKAEEVLEKASLDAEF